MITGIDYILYTNQNVEIFIQRMKESLFFWENPYFLIDYEDNVTNVYVAKNIIMFELMDEKGFYIEKDSGEGPFLLIFNDKYLPNYNRITLVLPKNIKTSKFTKKVFDWIKSISDING